MKRSLFAAVFLFLYSLHSAAERLPPLQPEDVFSLNYVSKPIVDSKGERVLYLRHSMDIMQDRRRSNLWSINVDGSRHRPVTSGAINVNSPSLAPDDNRVAWVVSNNPGAEIFLHWLDTGQTAQLVRLPSTPKNLAFSPDGKWLAFSMHAPATPPTMGVMIEKPKGAQWAQPPVVVDSMVYRDDGKGLRPPGFYQIFLLPADGGSARQLTDGDFHHGSAISWSSDSKSLYFSANRKPGWEQEAIESEIYTVDIRTAETTALTSRKGPDRAPVISGDGRHLAYLGFDDQQMGYHRNRLYIMNPDGNGRRELLEDFDKNIENPRWSADGKSLFFQFNEMGRTVLASTDLQGKVTRYADDLGGKSLGRPYARADYAVGGRGVYAFTSGGVDSPAELSVGRHREEPRRLTQLNSNLLDNRELGRVEEVWLKSASDGLDIQAWVVTPPGFDPAKKYPLILEIHGGPVADYGFHFSTEVQLYAAAGYVVLYANPRGSTGYGSDFANRIHHNYPSEDYDDLMSAVDEVLARGYVDDKQLYVTGGSGGGTLTAWIVGKTNRFRAAVVAKPVINWTSFVLTADNSPFFSRYWFASMPWEDPMGYWQRSPLSLVGNVSTPTMLLTGDSDLRTPIAETEQFYQALKLRGVDTTMVRIPGASHSIASRPSQLLGKVSAILAWFERYSGKPE